MLNVIMKFKKVIMVLLIGALLSGGMISSHSQEYYAEEDLVIALDAGHYINEPGKRSPYDEVFDCQKQEVQYNLSVVRLLEKKIKERNPNAKIYLTNPYGTDKTRGQRAVKSQMHNADYIISIHMNAIGNDLKWQDKVSGGVCLINENSTYKTKTIAQNIINDYCSGMDIPKLVNNGLYERGSQVGLLEKGTQLGIPSLLIELDFMDNYQVYRNFGDHDYLDRVTDVLADTIVKNCN